jgi:hypothetical protein
VIGGEEICGRRPEELTEGWRCLLNGNKTDGAYNTDARD